MKLDKEDKILGTTFAVSVVSILIIYIEGLFYVDALSLDSLFCTLALAAICMPFIMVLSTSSLFIVSKAALVVLGKIFHKRIHHHATNNKWLLTILIISFVLGGLLSVNLIFTFKPKTLIPRNGTQIYKPAILEL